MTHSRIEERTYRVTKLTYRYFPIILPIGFVLGTFIVWGMYTNLSFFGIADSQATNSLRYFYLFMIASMAVQFAFMFVKMISFLQPIKTVAKGIRIHAMIGGWQLVEWKEISEISAIEDSPQSSFPPIKARSRWLVKTTVPVQIPIKRQETISFFITNAHDNYNELLTLIVEQSGVKVTNATKKPKIPRWNSNNTP